MGSGKYPEMIHGSILQNMDHDARKLRAKKALDVTTMSATGSGRERRYVLMAEDRIEQHLKRTYGTGLNGQSLRHRDQGTGIARQKNRVEAPLGPDGNGPNYNRPATNSYQASLVKPNDSETFPWTLDIQNHISDRGNRYQQRDSRKRILEPQFPRSVLSDP